MSDFDRIVANLEYLSGDIADKVEKAVLKGMQQIQGDAKLLVDVDTGELRNSITASVKRDSELDIVGETGTNSDHAIFKEFGTGPRGASSAKDLPEGINPTYRQTPWTYYSEKYGFVRTEGQPARPFLYPAFKKNRAEIKANIEKAIKAALGEGNK